MGARKIKRHLRKVGWRFGWLLVWQSVIQALGFLINLLRPRSGKTLKPAWKLALEHNIPLLKCNRVNDRDTIEFLRALTPDLIVSAYFNQIVEKDVLSIPPFGILNIHPGWLPAYRGAMAYFWVLKNGSDTGGVSVHWMDEGIDTGQLLARKRFSIKPGKTQQWVLVMTAVIGTHLVRRIVQTIARGEKPVSMNIGEGEQEAYYPIPGEKEFDKYFRERRFFRIRDILGLFFSRHSG